MLTSVAHGGRAAWKPGGHDDGEGLLLFPYTLRAAGL